MKYKFNLMTNYPSELNLEIEKFNQEHFTDLRIIQVLDNEVTFVELEASISDELLFKFGVEFGKNNSKKNIEGRINFQDNLNVNNIPKSIIELEYWMKENCYNFISYSINGNNITEGFGIDQSNNLFNWYYTERGRKESLKSFKFEVEIVEYALNIIKSDKWAKTHCIGFSVDINKISELKSELRKMKIEYSDDEIPYYGIEKPVYRVFVLGCDIKKVRHLKEKYWTEK